MKTTTKQIIAPICAVLLCGLQMARAQLIEFQGDCTGQVLSAPTETSVRVRLQGVTEWPFTPICFWDSSGVRADGQTYSWQAVLIGDGLVVGPPDLVNTSVQFRYNGPSGSSLAQVEFFSPYPSEPLTNHVTSEGAFGTQSGPPLSFQGTLSLDTSNHFTVDITFTGGTPPLPAISDLIALLDGSSLSARQRRPLLATLAAGLASLERGNCQAGIGQLHAFQNKVDAQVRRSNAAVADALIACAQAIIDSACSD